MKNTAKTPKLPLIESLLAVVVLGLVGFTVWYVVQAKQSADDLLSQTNKSSAESLPADTAALSVSAAKLPADWKVASKSGQLVTLSSDAKKCSTTVANNQPPSQATGRNLGASQFTVQTTGGSQTVPSTVTRLSGGQALRYQSAGTLQTDGRQTNITATCNTQSDLTAAAAALQAVTVNQR